MLLTEAYLTHDAFFIFPDGFVAIVTFKACGYPVCIPRGHLFTSNTLYS